MCIAHDANTVAGEEVVLEEKIDMSRVCSFHAATRVMYVLRFTFWSTEFNRGEGLIDD